ncbi:hypothetical protein D3C87_1677510 [compost metagenome]
MPAGGDSGSAAGFNQLNEAACWIRKAKLDTLGLSALNNAAAFATRVIPSTSGWKGVGSTPLVCPSNCVMVVAGSGRMPVLVSAGATTFALTPVAAAKALTNKVCTAVGSAGASLASASRIACNTAVASAVVNVISLRVADPLRSR